MVLGMSCISPRRRGFLFLQLAQKRFPQSPGAAPTLTHPGPSPLPSQGSSTPKIQLCRGSPADTSHCSQGFPPLLAEIIQNFTPSLHPAATPPPLCYPLWLPSSSTLVALVHQSVTTASHKAQRGLLPAAELDAYIKFHPTSGSPREAQVTHAATTASLSPGTSPPQGDTASDKHRQERDVAL